MAAEQIILDGLALNDQVTWLIRADSFSFTPARKKFQWVSSALGDGAAQVGDEDHYEQAEMVFTIRAKPQADTDAGLNVFHELTQKLQKARGTPGGLPLVWAPANSAEALTFYVQNAEYDELHTSKEGGWFDHSPEMVVHLYLRPFGHGAESIFPLGYSDPFQFDSIGGGQWRWDSADKALATGSGSLTITGTPTTEKRMYLPWTTVDASVQIRVFVGTLGTAGLQVLARRSDASNYLRAGLGTASIAIAKVDGGAATTLASESYTYTASTFYLILASFVGDDINLGLYADGDTELSTPLISTQYTLAGAEQVEFGEGVRGNLGIRFVAPATDWYVTQYIVRGMDDVKSSEPIVSVEMPDVPGHVKAEARQVITEGSAKARRHFEMGWESRAYDTNQAPPVLLDSDVLSTGSFAGAQTTLGSGDEYNPQGGTDIVYASELSEVAAVTICSTGARKHVGAYRVKMRGFGSGGLRARLAYRVGSSQKFRNSWAVIEGPFQEVDLGTIVIPQAEIGTQSWQGWIEAYGINGGVIGVDYLMLIPVEGYGVARAPLEPIVADVFVARDSFDQAGGNLDTKTLSIGGAWVTSGDTPQAPPTGDFTIDDTNDWAQRTQIADAATNLGRYARAGTINYISVQLRVDTYITGYGGPTVPPGGSFRSGLLARYVDTNNWLMAVREPYVGTGVGASRSRLRVYKRVAGTVTQIGSVDHPTTFRPTTNMTLVLQVDATGVWQVYCFEAGTTQPSKPLKAGEDTDLATGGALATGKIGLYDAYTNTSFALTRIYNSFSAFSSTPDAILHPSRKLEIRSDRAEREDADGGDYGKLAYEGKRFYVAPAGDAGRVTRLVMKLRRNNVDEGLPDTNVGDDAHTLQVLGTPRYLHPVSD